MYCYHNNPIYSDIIIHFGENGEKTFHGHKVILAGSSCWFRTALAPGKFEEGESNEIDLKDDDATAIEKMFEFIYSRRLAPMDDILEVMELVWLAINIYQVADKYDVPDLLELAPQILKIYLENWADLCLGDCICDDEYRIEVNENIMKDFGEIVQRVYAVTGGKTSCSFREALVNTTQTYDQFRIMEPRGPFSSLAVHAAKGCHEFGKDMFLSLMEYSSLVIAS